MMSLSRKALLLMALILAAATAATAATAFAGVKKKLPHAGFQVVEAIKISADAAQHTKVRNLRVVNGNTGRTRLPTAKH
jgi:ABC-type glycerol-3-phosphate transport system substrate-binding protein